jgi:hypothetical protein
MKYKKLLYTRILFLFIPVIGFLIFYTEYRELSFSNFLERLDLPLIVLIITLGILTLDYSKIIIAYRKRKNALNNPDLWDTPKFPIDSKKMNFLDKRLSINPKTIDLSSQGTVRLHLNREDKYLEIKDFWGRKVVKFIDVKFILLEYNNYEKIYPIKRIFGGTIAYDKQVWVNRITVILLDGKELNLFEAKLHEYIHEAWEESQITRAYHEKSFLKNGKYLIRLLSNFMDKKYFVIDYTEGTDNAQQYS